MSRRGKPVLPIALFVLATAGFVVPPTALRAVELTGQVTDEDDAPIAGAVVTLHPVAGGAERGALWLAGEAHPESVARASTGEDGRFRSGETVPADLPRIGGENRRLHDRSFAP